MRAGCIGTGTAPRIGTEAGGEPAGGLGGGGKWLTEVA